MAQYMDIAVGRIGYPDSKVLQEEYIQSRSYNHHSSNLISPLLTSG